MSKGCGDPDTDFVDINIEQVSVVRAGRTYCVLLKVVERVSSKVLSLARRQEPRGREARGACVPCGIGLSQLSQPASINQPERPASPANCVIGGTHSPICEPIRSTDYAPIWRNIAAWTGGVKWIW